MGHSDGDKPAPLLAIGEVKWGERTGRDHLARLRHIRGLLTAKGIPVAADVKLACYSASGFIDDLRTEARRSSDVILIGASNLYGGR